MMFVYNFELQYVRLEARATEDIGWRLEDSGKGIEKSIKFTLHRISSGVSEYEIGHFSLAPMPGCCGMVVSTDSFLNKDSRHSGLSEPFRQLKHKLAKDLGYTVMIATSQTKDISALANMLKSKYEIVKVFRNKRTTNDVGIGIKIL